MCGGRVSPAAKLVISSYMDCGLCSALYSIVLFPDPERAPACSGSGNSGTYVRGSLVPSPNRAWEGGEFEPVWLVVPTCTLHCVAGNLHPCITLATCTHVPHTTGLLLPVLCKMTQAPQIHLQGQTIGTSCLARGIIYGWR